MRAKILEKKEKGRKNKALEKRKKGKNNKT